MKEESINKVKLGVFILTGTLLLVLGLYYIGSMKNVFHRTITVNTGFNNVNGLVKGNNVRFNGINVGTVSQLYGVNDTLVHVEFTVDEQVAGLIGDHAVVSIGTDGLLGNKLLNIGPGEGSHRHIADGSTLVSVNPLQMDNAMRSLSNTGNNLEVLTDHLKVLSGEISKPGSVWQTLQDSSVSGHLRAALVNVHHMSGQALAVTGDMKAITSGIRNGKGSIGMLMSDTSLAVRIRKITEKFEHLNDTAAVIAGDVSFLVKQLRQGKGAAGMLLRDTMVVHNLNTGILRIDTAASNLNNDAKALQHVWPFKKHMKSK